MDPVRWPDRLLSMALKRCDSLSALETLGFGFFVGVFFLPFCSL